MAHPIVPTGWPRIRATYDGITSKLKETKKVVDNKEVDVTEEDRLAAINYWIQCLLSDAIDVAKHKIP